jgi:hypothetical protein
MSKIRDLKFNQENNLNIVTVLELFSPDGKSKYTELLLRLMKNTPNLKEHTKEIKKVITEKLPFISKESIEQFGDIQLMLIYRFIDGFFNFEDLQKFRKFCEFNERNLIEENDLTKLKSFEQLISAMSMAEMKAEEKDLENQVIKILDNDEWLLLRPLTFNASKKYGANTKWCTTTEHNSEYFFKYTKKGVLIYCINKKTGYKVAAFYSLDKNESEFSYWNQKDSRIDSTDSELPLDLIGFIRDYVKAKGVKTNHFMLDEDTRKKEIGNKNDRSESINQRASRRVANAVRRAQQEIEVAEPNTYHEERAMEASYEDRDNMPMEQPESPIDRMQWSSTTQTTYDTDISETPTRL